jgi:hypothetical protein
MKHQWDSYDGLNYYFGEHQVFYESHGTCEMYVDPVIYMDDNDTYSFVAVVCSAEHYYYIKYNKEYIDITSALEEVIITIEEE